MADVEWYTIVIPLFSGGAAGALITSFVTAYRNRVQPIGKRVEFLPLFKDTLGMSSLRAKITVSDGQQDFSYNNLHVGQFQIVNQGNKDFGEFKFGMTLSDGDVVVSAEGHSPDRHHQATQLTPITLATPKSEVDFLLQPFNRRNTYSFQLLIVTRAGKEQPSPIQISSPEAVNFVDIPTISETIADLARSITLEVGPLKVFISR